VTTVNCTVYLEKRSLKNHILQGYGGSAVPYWSEGPNHRPDTRNRALATAAHPSAWVGVCHIARGDSTAIGPRTFTSHFGARSTLAGLYTFNILHLDGHVDDSVWKDPYPFGNWLVYGGPGWDQRQRPYGWWTQGDATLGYKELPEFEGAFDQNARECRRVSRVP